MKMSALFFTFAFVALTTAMEEKINKSWEFANLLRPNRELQQWAKSDMMMLNECELQQWAHDVGCRGAENKNELVDRIWVHILQTEMEEKTKRRDGNVVRDVTFLIFEKVLLIKSTETIGDIINENKACYEKLMREYPTWKPKKLKKWLKQNDLSAEGGKHELLKRIETVLKHVHLKEPGADDEKILITPMAESIKSEKVRRIKVARRIQAKQMPEKLSNKLSDKAEVCKKEELKKMARDHKEVPKFLANIVIENSHEDMFVKMIPLEKPDEKRSRVRCVQMMTKKELYGFLKILGYQSNKMFRWNKEKLLQQFRKVYDQNVEERKRKEAARNISEKEQKSLKKGNCSYNTGSAGSILRVRNSILKKIFHKEDVALLLLSFVNYFGLNSCDKQIYTFCKQRKNMIARMWAENKLSRSFFNAENKYELLAEDVLKISFAHRAELVDFLGKVKWSARAMPFQGMPLFVQHGTCLYSLRSANLSQVTYETLYARKKKIIEIDFAYVKVEEAPLRQNIGKIKIKFEVEQSPKEPQLLEKQIKFEELFFWHIFTANELYELLKNRKKSTLNLKM